MVKIKFNVSIFDTEEAHLPSSNMFFWAFSEALVIVPLTGVPTEFEFE
jgi:hypothetical protein